MDPEVKLEIDFCKDWIDSVRRELCQSGYVIDPSEADRDLALKYFHLQHRKIAPRPRTIYKSKVLTCPPSLRSGLDQLIEKVRLGQDISPHLSKGLQKLDYHDALLSDWGIHHFHLGTTLEPDGFITRTGPLLFARVTADDFFVINVLEHGSWSDTAMLQVLHENWPDSLSKYKIQLFPGLVRPSNDDHKQARMGGVTAIITMQDGTVYRPPGGGINTARGSVRAFDDLRRQINYLRQLQDAVVQQAPSVLASIDVRPDGRAPIRLQRNAPNWLILAGHSGRELATIEALPH